MESLCIEFKINVNIERVKIIGDLGCPIPSDIIHSRVNVTQPVIQNSQWRVSMTSR